MLHLHSNTIFERQMELGFWSIGASLIEDQYHSKLLFSKGILINVTNITDSGDQRFVQTTLIGRIGTEHADYMKKLSKMI